MGTMREVGVAEQETAAEFRPFRPVHGYLPIEDHGLIGDGTTAALAGRDGVISWLCIPRFDSPPLFCGILDAHRGGGFRVQPEGLNEGRQFYLRDSGVLVTELRSSSGVVRITDALTLRSGADLTEDVSAGRGELLRSVEVLHGPVRLHIAVNPREGARAKRSGNGLDFTCSKLKDVDLHLASSVPLEGLETVLDLDAGERLQLTLSWSGTPGRYRAISAEDQLKNTVDAWHRWARNLEYEGPHRAVVRRSAVTLKLLDYFDNGAIMAAPTSSLPESIGSSRNWDYRYAWVRDAAFSVYAFQRIGLEHEAAGFLDWVLTALERHGKPRILYDADGEVPPPEWEDDSLEGYRGSRPVRWGNGASEQEQHDVYGEIIDCAYQWTRHHGELDEALWTSLRQLIEGARTEWRTPDHGIWEVRTLGRPFTYSAALCHVALDRGVRLAERFGLAGDTAGWRTEAERIHKAILDEAWDDDLNSITEHLGGGQLDASLLSLPLRRVLPADHPKMVATTEAVTKRLGAGNGLLYRYLPDHSPDGLPGHEGAFLLCSFWLVDNLANQGRLDEAMELFDSLCARANPLGLLPEQIDPGTGAFLGNFPQAFSHIGVISSAINLVRRS